MRLRAGPGAKRVAVPRYLDETYWWAYVHPAAVRVFERQWLVNLILFGNYARLRDAALAEFGPRPGRSLQIACVYGDLTERLSTRIGADASLDVVDVLPVQLSNLARKLNGEGRARLFLGDSSALGVEDASYDRALLFFLLHEQPADVRRATLAEALRVVKPGGTVVVVDYHRPARWHPVRPLLKPILGRLEPYAKDLWREDLSAWLPANYRGPVVKQTYFGALYQKVVLRP